MKREKIIIFTCNWGAYSGLEAAGRHHLPLPASVYPVRVACIGRVGAGIILKAFEKGARGVLLMGCRSDECHFGFGQKQAESTVAMAKDLLNTLGLGGNRLEIGRINTGDGKAWMKTIEMFMRGLTDADRSQGAAESAHQTT